MTPSRRQRSQAASESSGIGDASRSRTVTRRPSRASIIAADRPQRPPPSTLVWGISPPTTTPLSDLFPHVHLVRAPLRHHEQERPVRSEREGPPELGQFDRA